MPDGELLRRVREYLTGGRSVPTMTDLTPTQVGLMDGALLAFRRVPGVMSVRWRQLDDSLACRRTQLGM